MSLPRSRLLLAALVALVLGTAVAWAFGLYSGQIDLRVYRMGGSVLLDGGELYDARLAGSGLPFTYPPFAAVMMVPLALAPWWLAVTVWAAISIRCLGVIWRASVPAGAAERARLALKVRPELLLVAAVVGSLALEPVRETLGFGQINLVLTALVLIDLTGGRRRLRGALLGVAIGLKLTPVIFLGYLVVTRQWRILRNAVLGAAATVAIGFAVVPGQSWRYWTEVVADAERVGGLPFTANQSVMGFLTRVLGDSGAVRPLWFVVSSALCLTALWLAWRLHARGDRVGAVSVTGLAGLFASPVSWSHHWIWIIPLGVTLLLTAAGRMRGRGPVVAIGVAWCGVFALGPIWWVPYRDDRELDWTFWQALPGNSYLIAGLAALGYLAWTTRAPRLPR